MPDSPTITDHLHIAAPYAIYKWMDGEKHSVYEIQRSSCVNEDVLSRWLTAWSLHRGIPKDTRKELAKRLHDLRKKFKNARKNQLPTLVAEVADTLNQNEITNGQQTSLISKFAFSLRPEIAAPYDRYARKGLSAYYGCQPKELAEYSTYFEIFDQFVKECGKELRETGLIETLYPLWHRSSMNKTIFKRRTADKLLMILGGLMSIDNLSFWGFISDHTVDTGN